jgi:Glucose / Sorbosone dehydrogenase
MQPAKNTVFHNGGQLAFGSGNLLYIAIGDDTDSANAQDLTDLLGGILRITPNVAGTVPAYTIPNGNPFKGNAHGYREEIYAYGMRNPWRFSFDSATGKLWAGDVGQTSYEEIDIVLGGRNYGWPFMEAFECYLPADCDTAGRDLVLPLYAYDHDDGRAIIGGHVYHGTRFPGLQGRYIFADYMGTIWSLTYDGVNPPVRAVLVPDGPTLYTIGVGNRIKYDLYFSSSSGPIYRLSPVVTDAPESAPSRTSLLGNFPNPFNPATTIRYELARPGRVVLEIMAVGGARIRTLDHGTQPIGIHELPWRGETESGGRAASGVYFCRLVVDGVAHGAVRMVLVE